MGSLFQKLKLHGALVLLQLGFAGFEILTKNLLTGGFSPFVYPVYRNALAFAVLAPFAYFSERDARPRITVRQVPLFLLAGTIGIFCNQVCYIVGLRYTSASFTSAYRNTMPIYTFVIAALLGMERVEIRKRDGRAKVFGTLAAVVGSLVMTLLPGPVIIEPFSVSSNRLHGSFHLNSWDLGVAILSAGFFAFAVFLTLQAHLLKSYPAPLSIATISIAIGGVELALLAAVLEPQKSKWQLTSSSMVVAVVYAGVIASGLVSAIQSWGVKKGGPVTVASYQPLETVIVSILSFFFLKESFHLGGLFGAFLVIFGLYSLIWGQATEKKRLVAEEESLKQALIAEDEKVLDV